MDGIGKSTAGQEQKLIVSALSAYLLAVGIALVAGVLLDRFGPKLALAFVVAIPLMLLGIRDFRLVCAAAIFVLPFVPTVLLSRKVTGVPGIPVLTSLLAFGAASIFLYCALRPRHIVMPRLPLILLLYLAVLVWGALNGARHVSETPDYLQALGLIDDKTPGTYLKSWAIAPLLVVGTALAAGVLAANTRDVRWIVVPMLCSAMGLAAIVYLFALKGGATIGEMAGQDARRLLSGTGQHANEISLSLNMALAITLAVAAGVAGRLARLILLACALVLMGGVYLTFSRGGYIGTATVLIYFFISFRGKWHIKLSLLVLLACVMLAAPDAMIKRTVDTGSGGSLENASSGRVSDIWRPLLPSVAQNPLAGKGHGSILWSDAAKQRKILPVGHPHNAYLAALLDVGLVGTVVILAFLGHVWRCFWRQSASQARGPSSAFFHGASACIAILLVQGLTDDTFMPRYTHSYMWIAYGAALGRLSRHGRGRHRAPHPSPTRLTSITRDET